jgi:hypothetical protein
MNAIPNSRNNAPRDIMLAPLTAWSAAPEIFTPVDGLSLTNSLIDSFEVATLNTTYQFVRTDLKDEIPIWYVLVGRPQIQGKYAQVLSLRDKCASPLELRVGDRLAICEIDGDYSLPLYTSRVIGLMVGCLPLN